MLPVVPVSGNTGLNGGALGTGAIVISLARMNRIREIRPNARVDRAETAAWLYRFDRL